MSPTLKSALEEARVLVLERSWTEPSQAAVDEAERLLTLTAAVCPGPDVHVEPDGAIVLEWEVAARGWLSLSVNGSGTVNHSAVIDDDEYSQAETFLSALPDWAGELLHRLYQSVH